MTFRAVGWRVRQRDYEYRGVNYPFGKVGSMHFLRVASVRVEEQPRKRPAGFVQEHARSGPSSSSGVFSHHPDDRPWLSARLHSPLEVAARDGSSRTTIAAAVPRVVLDSTWAVHHQRLGGEGQEVRSVRKRRCSGAGLLGQSLGTIVPGSTDIETRRPGEPSFAFAPLDNRVK